MRYEITKTDQKAIDEWLSNGNKIDVCPPGARTEQDDIVYTWGKKKKPAAKKSKNAK
jgi:hypothetical protein